MNDKKELRVSIIPNRIIEKHFKMQNVGGVYRIIDNRTGNVIYNNGRCINCGSVDINIDGVVVGLAIRSIAYVLRYDNNNSDYHMFNIVEPNGSTPEEKARHLKNFDVDSIKCYSRARIEWKNLPRVKDVQWSVREKRNQQPQQSKKTDQAQLVMNLNPSSEVKREDVAKLLNMAQKTWDVEINGVVFTFKNKDVMLEMCKSIANK